MGDSERERPDEERRDAPPEPKQQDARADDDVKRMRARGTRTSPFPLEYAIPYTGRQEQR